MFPVPVGRFHEHDVGVLEGHGILVQWRAARSDVAREHDDLPVPLFLNGDLEARRAEDVTGLDRSNADTRRDSGRVVVAHPPVQGLQALDVLWRVERRDRGLAGSPCVGGSARRRPRPGGMQHPCRIRSVSAIVAGVA